jgi:TIR domain
MPGRRWARAVEEAMVSSPRMLVVLSPASVLSTNVEDEIAFALEERKNVIPILHRDCQIPFRLRNYQYADFRTNYELGLASLLRVMNASAAKPFDEEIGQASRTRPGPTGQANPTLHGAPMPPQAKV